MSKECAFHVGSGGGRRYPATPKGMLMARVAAKRMAFKDGGSNPNYSIRFSCFVKGGRHASHEFERCSMSKCEAPPVPHRWVVPGNAKDLTPAAFDKLVKTMQSSAARSTFRGRK